MEERIDEEDPQEDESGDVEECCGKD